VFPAVQEMELGGLRFEANLGRVSMKTCLTNKSKRTGYVAQVVEHFPGKCKALNLIHSTVRKDFRAGDMAQW
jgi:hypothetical protein